MPMETTIWCFESVDRSGAKGQGLCAESQMPHSEARNTLVFETRIRILSQGAAKVCLSHSGVRFYHPTCFLPHLESRPIFVSWGCQDEYHRLGGLKQPNCISSWLGRPEVQGVSRLPSLQRAWGRTPPYCFWLFGGSRCCLVFENSSHLCFCLHKALSSSLCFLFCLL